MFVNKGCLCVTLKEFLFLGVHVYQKHWLGSGCIL